MRTIDEDDLVRLLEEAGGSFAVPAHGPDEVLGALDEQPVVVPLHRRRWARVVAAAAVVAGAVAAGAVLSGATTEDARLQAAPSSAARQPAALDQYAGEVSRSAALTSTGAVEAPAVAAPQAAPFAPTDLSTGAVAGGTTQAQAPTAVVPDGPVDKVVKNGAIALIVGDGEVSERLTEVQAVATGLGGYVQDASTQESGDTPSGKVVLRVPVKQFEAAVARVRALDAEVRSATTTGKDVTAEYADLEQQLRTLRATRERFLEILSRTRTIGEILSVQQRVDGVTAQIDRIEGQRKVLAAQAENATLEVTVTEADDPVVAERDRPAENGLVTAVKDAKDSFVDGVEGLVRHSGTALLLLLCAAATALVGRLAWRRARRRLV
jgi:hypothetical protein